MGDYQDLLDRAEIQDLWYRYSRGIDRCDLDLVKSVYHEGATDNHGVFNGDAAEFAEFVIPLLRDSYVNTQHHLTNMSLRIDGDRATGEVYFIAHHRTDNDDGTSTLTTFGGRYLDRLERRNGRWGIVERTVAHDWSQDTVGPRYGQTELFPQGMPSREDASYRLLP